MAGDLDPRAVLASLGVADVDAVVPVSGGQDTAIWRVEAGGRSYALRVFRAEQQGTCGLETAVMTAAAAAGMTVPGVSAAGEWQGRPAMLIDWCPGRPMLAEVFARPWRLWPMALAFGRAHARLHRVPAPAEVVARRGDWVGWIGTGDPELDARLRGPGVRRDALLHLDYHPLNVLMADGQVTAVIDWTNAHAGDPRADVARAVTILRLAPLPPRERVLLAPVRGLLAAGYLRGYVQEAGELPGMAPFYAWAGAVMRREWGWRLGKPGAPVRQRDLDAMDRWVQRWRSV